MMNTLPARRLPVARPHTREKPQLYIYPQRRDVIAISEGRFAIQRRARPPPGVSSCSQLGEGQYDEQSLMALPHSLGHVTTCSKLSFMSLMNRNHDSNGCSTIQITAQNEAMGHAERRYGGVGRERRCAGVRDCGQGGARVKEGGQERRVRGDPSRRLRYGRIFRSVRARIDSTIS